MIPTNRPPTHPGEMLLEDFLKPLQVTQVEAAERMHIPLNRLNQLIRAKRGVTADTALLLSALTGTSAEFWMNLQAKWDLWHAQRERERQVGKVKIKALASARARFRLA